MIAIPRFEAQSSLIASEARRRVGGRALAVSEYAKKLSGAIKRLMELAQRTRLANAWSSDEFDEVIQLDGRIEALRMRLAIEHQSPPESWELPFHDGTWVNEGKIKVIGFTKLTMLYAPRDPNYDLWSNGDCPPDPGCAFLFALGDHNWRLRMLSLKSIADELAEAPELDPEEEEIVRMIMTIGHRLTTTQLLNEFSKLGIVKAESTIKGKLAQLTKRKVLVNRSDTSPKGYGLPEWS